MNIEYKYMYEVIQNVFLFSIAQKKVKTHFPAHPPNYCVNWNQNSRSYGDYIT